MIMFSKAYDLFYKKPNKNQLEYKRGDIFSDNLQKSDSYDKDIELFDKKIVNKNDLSNNYWEVIRESDSGFLAINLETMMIFHFNETGEVTHYVNDIDGRWTYPSGKYYMITNAFEHYKEANFSFHQNFDKQDQKYYKLVEIVGESYFYGLTLVTKESLTNKQREIISQSNRRMIKVGELKYTSPRDSAFRNNFMGLMEDLEKKVKHNNVDFYHKNLDFYDENMKFNGSRSMFYDRYIFDNFMEKSISVLYKNNKDEEGLIPNKGLLKVNGIPFISGYEEKEQYRLFREVYQKMFKKMNNNEYTKNHWLNKYSNELTNLFIKKMRKRYGIKKSKIREDFMTNC